MDPETKKEFTELEKQIEELNNQKQNNGLTNTINKLSPGVAVFITILTLISSGLFQVFSVNERVNSMSYRMTDFAKQIQELDNNGTRKSELRFSIMEEKMRNHDREIEELKDQVDQLRATHNLHEKLNSNLKRRSDFKFDQGLNTNTVLTEKRL